MKSNHIVLHNHIDTYVIAAVAGAEVAVATVDGVAVVAVPLPVAVVFAVGDAVDDDNNDPIDPLPETEPKPAAFDATFVFATADDDGLNKTKQNQINNTMIQLFH